MGTILVFAAGFVLGSIVGVIIMALVQINNVK